MALAWGMGVLAAGAADAGTSTLRVAERVTEKGLTIVDLGKYPGMLLLHGMGEMARVHPEKKGEWLRRTVELFQRYPTGEIKGRGSFICYEAGGTGAAMLHYWKLADALAGQVDAAALRMVQHQKRSTEGLLIPHWANESQVFIDMAFPVTPFLLYAGLAFDRPDHVNLGVDETLELFRILEDKETGLVHQGRGFNGDNVISDDNWSEGNGWGAFALALLVRDLPAQHPRRPQVVGLAQTFFAAVLRYQDANGMWHQEMTDETSYVETSGTGLLLYGLGIMIESGLLDPRHTHDIKRGVSGYLGYIDADGSVSHTCKACLCPGNGTKEAYKNYNWVFNDPHAFGPVVLAFAQALRLGIERIEPLAAPVPMPGGGICPVPARGPGTAGGPGE